MRTSGHELLRRLLPKQPVYLVSNGHGDERRFIDLFRRTWRRLPYSVRRRILKYWRTWHPALRYPGIGVMRPGLRLRVGRRYDAAKLLFGPRVELVWGWTPPPHSLVVFPDDDEQEQQSAYAEVSARGYLLRFRSQDFDEMPEDVAQDVIAHELIHVLQFVDGYEQWFGKPNPCEGVIEEVADMAMERLGFDPESVDRWAVRVGRTRGRMVSEAEYIESLYGPGGRYHNPAAERAHAWRELAR
jgi:hypothetical protein